MSLISGLMLGSSIGKAIHGMFLKNGSAGLHVSPLLGRKVKQGTEAPKQGQADTAHMLAFSCVAATPGRRRYRVASLVQNQELATLLEEQLSQLSRVDKVQVSALTGSILICAHEEIVLDEIEQFLRFQLFPQVKQEENDVSSSHGGPTVYMEKIYETLDVLSHFILQKTGRLFDLRSIISLVLIVRGIRKILTFDQRPTGPQMLWWAAALLRGRR